MSKGATAHSSQCDSHCAIWWQMFSKSLPASRDLFCELETGHRSLSHEGRHRRNWPEIKRGGALSGLGITRAHRTQNRHGGTEIPKKTVENQRASTSSPQLTRYCIASSLVANVGIWRAEKLRIES